MNDRIYFIFIFFLSPMLGIFAAFKSVSQKNIVFFFILTMGSFGFLYSYGGVGDGTVHYEIAKQYYTNMSFYYFIYESWNIIIQQPTINPVDLYIHSLYFFSASILNWPGGLHLFAGIILG